MPRVDYNLNLDVVSITVSVFITVRCTKLLDIEKRFEPCK